MHRVHVTTIHRGEGNDVMFIIFNHLFNNKDFYKSFKNGNLTSFFWYYSSVLILFFTFSYGNLQKYFAICIMKISDEIIEFYLSTLIVKYQ